MVLASPASAQGDVYTMGHCTWGKLSLDLIERKALRGRRLTAGEPAIEDCLDDAKEYLIRHSDIKRAAEDYFLWAERYQDGDLAETMDDDNAEVFLQSPGVFIDHLLRIKDAEERKYLK